MTAVYALLVLFALLLVLPALGFGLVVVAAYRELRASHEARGVVQLRRGSALVDAYRMAHRAKRGNW